MGRLGKAVQVAYSRFERVMGGSLEISGLDWTNVVVVCAGKSWDSPWGGEKHLATRLTAFAPVLFVDPPVSLLTPARQRQLRRVLSEPRLRLVAPRLARLTPLAPPGVSRPGLRELARRSTRQALRRSLALMGAHPETVIVASLDDLFGACGERRRVLFGTDDFVAGAALMGLDEAWLRRRETLQLRSATDVVAISPTLADRWRHLGRAVTLIPNGVDAAAYRNVDRTVRASEVSLPDPIVGFVGHLSRRIDFGMLQAIADRGHSLLLVGPASPAIDRDELERLISSPNVQWVGPRPFEELPSFLSCMAVGVTPYADSPFNRASFPLKTLEYLAAGRGAVSTDLPAVRWLDTNLVRIAGDVPAFLAELEDSLAETATKQLKVARQDFAAEHSWDVRMRQWTDVLGLT